MVTIENADIKVNIEPKGAELQSVFSKSHQLEYLWDGDPVYWGKHSPVLFPIVGTLKDNRYLYNGHTYTLNRHGFARDMLFATEKLTAEEAGFLLKSSEETLRVYPFSFEFRITYTLSPARLRVTYTVMNTGADEMLFSVGGHPAFKVPLTTGTLYADYYLEFNEEETKPRWPISKDGLIEKTPVPLLQSTDNLPLTKDLFSNDAVVLKFLTSSMVSLKSDKTNRGLDFNFSGFPYLGLWAAPGADFVCIEPWCGIADSVDSDQQLAHKEGIERLKPGGSFERNWSIDLF